MTNITLKAEYLKPVRPICGTVMEYDREIERKFVYQCPLPACKAQLYINKTSVQGDAK